MRGVNKVILVGTFGKDPEIKNLPQGGAAGNFSLATNESWIDKNTNEKKEQTEWHRVVVYQRLAEIVGQYMKKGSKVYVEGKLTTRKWTDKDGVERYTTEIVANEVQMLDSQGQQSGGQQQAPAYQAPQQAAPQQQAPQGGYQKPQQQSSPAYQQPQQAPAQQQPAYQQPQQQPAPPPPPADFDDDIPF